MVRNIIVMLSSRKTDPEKNIYLYNMAAEIRRSWLLVHKEKLLILNIMNRIALTLIFTFLLLNSLLAQWQQVNTGSMGRKHWLYGGGQHHWLSVCRQFL